MSSIFQRPNGTTEIAVVVGDRRPVLRLGRCGVGVARAVALHCDRLSRAVTHSADLPRDTQAWLASIDDGLHERLARAGLCGPRAHHRPGAVALGKMCDDYIATRCDVTEGTKSVMRQFRIHAAPCSARRPRSPP